MRLSDHDDLVTTSEIPTDRNLNQRYTLVFLLILCGTLVTLMLSPRRLRAQSDSPQDLMNPHDCSAAANLWPYEALMTGTLFDLPTDSSPFILPGEVSQQEKTDSIHRSAAH